MIAVREAAQKISAVLKRYWLGLLFALVVLINMVAAYQFFLAPRPAPARPVETNKSVEPTGPISRLTGEYMSEDELIIIPIAAMIDNIASARPAKGLNQAAIVFETLVEGGITRLLGVWQIKEDAVIGPVRSARHYFLPWARELNAVYAHSGGNVSALKLLAGDKSIRDADEFRNGGSYFRDKIFSPPHDLFSSTNRLQALAASYGWMTEPPVLDWHFSDDEPGGEPAKIVIVDFSLTPYKVRWSYDESSKQYKRVVGGKIDEDRLTGQQITATNIIVLKTEIVPDKSSKEPDAVVVTTIGEGEALVFRRGVVTIGRWRKTLSESRLEFIDSENKPIELSRGRSWIEVVSADKAEALQFE